MQTLAEQLVRKKWEVEREEERLKALKKEYEDLAKLVAEDFVTKCQTKVGLVVDGRKVTVSRRRNFCCNVLAANREKLVEAMRQIGMEDMIETTVSTSKLKPWLKELVGGTDREDDDPFDYDRLPPEIRSLVRIHEDVVPVVVNR